jgi:MerR family mercuric resistance operon transcriptional regulator
MKVTDMSETKINDGQLTIGRLAKRVNVNVETIRYYQRIGLIDEPVTPVYGFRKYPLQTAKNITFIKRAQRLGFSLKEIAELLQIGDGHCDDVRHRAEKKRNKIEDQIRDLQSLRNTLDQLICECKSGTDGAHCPIVETLLTQDIES